MKVFSCLVLSFLLMSASASAQTKTNETMVQQLKGLKADENITLTYDPASNMSKIMAVSENFSDDEAASNGLLAINFAVGFFYHGEGLDRSPDPIMLTFWVMTKKPRFSADHDMTVFGDAEVLTIGTARYVAKPRMNMEYLNFEISREHLTRIAERSNVRFRLGQSEFTFTKRQLKMLADLLLVSAVE